MDPNTTVPGNLTPPTPFFTDFTLQEFVDDHQDLNFDQVIGMIRGSESPAAADPINNFINEVNLINTHSNFDHLSHTFSSTLLPNNDQNNGNDNNNNDAQYCGIFPKDVFTNFNSPTMSCTDSTILNPFLGFEDDVGGNGGEDNNYGEAEHSSATATTATTTTPPGKKAKVDRSRTLISERRRRGRMKEKLYALRALVPNITKMDKASIVGDAVLYVQDLQVKAKKLKSEIEGLQSSFKAAERSQLNNNPAKIPPINHNFLPVPKTIMQMDVHQLEEREFYVKIVSNRGRGVATSLYKALETFSSFLIQNSNLATICERFLLTFTLNVGKCREDMNLPNLKLWVIGAFLNQGFEFQAL